MLHWCLCAEHSFQLVSQQASSELRSISASVHGLPEYERPRLLTVVHDLEALQLRLLEFVDEFSVGGRSPGIIVERPPSAISSMTAKGYGACGTDRTACARNAGWPPCRRSSSPSRSPSSADQYRLPGRRCTLAPRTAGFHQGVRATAKGGLLRRAGCGGHNRRQRPLGARAGCPVALAALAAGLLGSPKCARRRASRTRTPRAAFAGNALPAFITALIAEVDLVTCRLLCSSGWGVSTRWSRLRGNRKSI